MRPPIPRLKASHCWPLLLNLPSNFSKIARCSRSLNFSYYQILFLSLLIFVRLMYIFNFLLIGQGRDRIVFNISLDSSIFSGVISSSSHGGTSWPSGHTNQNFLNYKHAFNSLCFLQIIDETMFSRNQWFLLPRRLSISAKAFPRDAALALFIAFFFIASSLFRRLLKFK